MLNCGKVTIENSIRNKGINEGDLHLAHPWLLEGAIRGSYYCIAKLIKEVYDKSLHPPRLLISYWSKIPNKIDKWDIYTSKEYKNRMERICCICGKEDTETLTLQQCSGCSLFCYCSEECQNSHWDIASHREECKQYQILIKYHKPYMKE